LYIKSLPRLKIFPIHYDCSQLLAWFLLIQMNLKGFCFLKHCSIFKIPYCFLSQKQL
jgi:hypothetical protein